MGAPRRSASKEAAVTKQARIVLSIEDQTIGNLAQLTLRHGPYDLRVVDGMKAMRTALEELKPHLLILDVDDDDGRAIDVIGESPRNDRVPTIALTRRADLKRQLEAFERGADDCIGVPFVPSDLVARVVAVLRRAYGSTRAAYRPLQIGELEIDLVGRQVRTHGSDIHLTSVEQALLYLLAANAGTVLTRDMIMDSIWGADFVAGSNVIDQHVRSLRAKLQNDWRKPKYIETVPGIGYRFSQT